MSDVYSQIVFNRTANDVTKFEQQRNKPAFTPAWILKITWDHVMPVAYQKINFSEVKRFQTKQIYFLSFFLSFISEHQLVFNSG